MTPCASHERDAVDVEGKVARIAVTGRKIDVLDLRFCHRVCAAIRRRGHIDQVSLGCAVANEFPVAQVACRIGELHVEVLSAAGLHRYADVRIRRKV